MNWNEIYKKLGVVQKEPKESVKEFVSLLKKESVKKVLDLGCGTGRHTILLAQEGFSVVASDNSQEALDVIKKIVKEARIKNIKIVKNDMTSIPSPNGYFDSVLCYDVIQHGVIKKAKKTVSEIKRVLKKNKLILVNVVSTKHFSYGTGREIEPGTFVDMKDKLDGDIPHHFYTKSKMKDLFSDFEIIKLKEFIVPSELNPDKMSGEWLLIARKK